MSMYDFTTDFSYKYIHWSFVVSGLWPFQSSVLNKKLRIVTYIVINSAGLPQILAIRNRSDKNVDMILEIFILFVICYYVFAKYISLCFHHTEITFILNKGLDLKKNTNKKELKIILNAFAIRRFYTGVYFAYIIFAGAVMISLQISPIAINLYHQSNNHSEIEVYQNHGDYIINLDDYPNFANLHACFAGGFFSFIHGGFDLFFLQCVTHLIALIRLLCHKLLNFGKAYKDNDKDIQIRNAILRQEIKSIVQLHCEIFKYVNALEKTYCYSHLSSLFLCILLVPLTSYVFQYCLDKPVMAGVVILFCSSFVLELLFLNLAGQKLIDESEKIIESAYFSCWYELPNEFRKSLRIIMIRSINPIQLSAGKLTILSLETFEKALKTAVSYFTAMLTIF